MLGPGDLQGVQGRGGRGRKWLSGDFERILAEGAVKAAGLPALDCGE